MHLDLKDTFGATALIRATWKGHIKVVELLIKAGANLDLQNKRGDTALIRAVWMSHDKVVDLLIKAGAKTRIRNKEGKSVLDLVDKGSVCYQLIEQKEKNHLFTNRTAFLDGVVVTYA